MLKIVGHRGAAGLALENTMPSFEAAIKAGATCVEFDVHETKDNVFVVCHDDSLERVSNSRQLISRLTFAELQGIPLNNGSAVPTLKQVLDFARSHQLAVVVEYKAGKNVDAFCELLDDYSDLDLVVASFDHGSMAQVRKLRPKLRIYLAENSHPFEVLSKVRSIRAQGIDLNYKLLNPLTYWACRLRGLEIMVYTVNSLWAKKFIQLLYPGVAICTNYPDRFIDHENQATHKSIEA